MELLLPKRPLELLDEKEKPAPPNKPKNLGSGALGSVHAAFVKNFPSPNGT